MQNRAPVVVLGINSDTSISLFLQGFRSGQAKRAEYGEHSLVLLRADLLEVVGRDPIHIYSQKELQEISTQLLALYSDTTNLYRMGFISGLLEDPRDVLKVLRKRGCRTIEARQVLQSVLH